MEELDLIPNEYRRQQRVRRWFTRFAIIYGALLIVIIGARLSLAWQHDRLTTSIQQLEAGERLDESAQQRLASMVEEKTLLQRRVAILNQLRGGASVREIFRSIDQVMSPEVWFSKWSFERAGEYRAADPEATHTGYIIVISEDPNSATEQAWRLRTNMAISGQTSNHGELAGFVQRLIAEPLVEDAQVLQTTTLAKGNSQVIGFNVAITLADQGAG